MPASQVALMVQSSPDPVSISEAQSGTEWKSKEAAIKVELSAMKELGVWTLAQLPPWGRKTKHKWVFLKKMNPDGTLNKYRASQVACGSSQVHGQNYFEAFSPTMGLDNVRMLLALAAHYDLEVQTRFSSVE